MAGWDEIFEEVQQANCLDRKTTEYLKKLQEKTGRNIVVYFSAWQQKVGIGGDYSITDDDRNGFMSALKGLDKTRGLDLILHTPGGDLSATTSIVEYLYAFFNGDIRVIVPSTAMSAGTMIACAAKEIIMGLHSNLGPIDPQINGAPANEYIELLKKAQDDIANNRNINYWIQILQKYAPTFYGVCEKAIKMSKKYAFDWLKRGMMSGGCDEDINSVVEFLSDYNKNLNHNTRFCIKELQDKTGLKIKALEDDSELQDLVLSIYHCFVILATTTQVNKIIENNNGKKYIRNSNIILR